MHEPRETIPEPALTEPLPASPLPTIERWLAEARDAPEIRNHDAMALATVDGSGAPQVRMVLCRGFDPERGTFSFYTNRESPKAKEVEHGGRVSAAFYWDALSRQVRFSGPVARTSDAESDAYFAGRHPLSQLAAWTSRQSQPIASRAELVERFEQVRANYRAPEGMRDIPRPPHWGGYRIVADRIELWVSREGRLHDRAVWTRDLAIDADHADRTDRAGAAGEPSAAGRASSVWSVRRLQP